VWEDVKTVQAGDCVGVGADRELLRVSVVYKQQQESTCKAGVRIIVYVFTGAIAHEQLVFPITDGLKSEDIASMLSLGVTVFVSLIRNGAGPSEKVRVIGTETLVSIFLLFVLIFPGPFPA
jgi:D-arabinose 1-dehydrogenase-like Zn-dependent alcohol dehydrogenase